MLDSFLAFNVNAVSHFIYLLTDNLFLLLLIASVIGTILLKLKDEIDSSIREEQNVI